MSEDIRLSKLMSQRGICSRREADSLIEKGWVMVNGTVINKLGSKFSENCEIELTSEGQNWLGGKRTVLLHKPIGYASHGTDEGYKTVFELIQAKFEDSQFKVKGQKWDQKLLTGLAPAGRLDIDSTGLIILTQDGQLAKQVIDQMSEIEKEYLVRVQGGVNQKKINQLKDDLRLDGKKLKPAQVEEIEPGLLRFVLIEGRKRQIRRMCELVDLKVTQLKRVRIGQIRLGSLKKGYWRFLRNDESF